jgi:hypothetical protein
MYNQIVYGSLLHKDELKKQNIDPKRVDFVKVKGYKRVFNQEPSWRIVQGNEKAVMNIEEDENSWFNAIVIKDLDEKYIKELDHRERGYDRISLKKECVTLYDDNSTLNNCIVYKGKKGKQNNTIFPNPSYFKICLEGAKSHFEQFFKDYMDTTYKNSKNGELELIKE